MQGALVALHDTLQNLRNPTNSASLPTPPLLLSDELWASGELSVNG